MNVLRTPEHRFADLPEYPFAPHYTEVDGMRLHYVDESLPRTRSGGAGETVLLLHGEPTWSYLYRTMIPVLTDAGLRAVAPDLPGFGKSDKPARIEDFSYARLVGWMADWMDAVDLPPATLVCQDWGSLIGLRLVAEHPDRFARVVVANGFLPTADRPPPLVFKIWQLFARYTPIFPHGWIVRAGCAQSISPEVRAAYDAPFPDASYEAGPRALPRLVPLDEDDPAIPANRAAWDALGRFEKPFLTAFATGDPIFRGADRVLQNHVPGAAGQPHTHLRGAGHFVQEDRGPDLARLVADFVRAT
jgi:haloalkane dehalogenase